jgi:hypothetical protein
MPGIGSDQQRVTERCTRGDRFSESDFCNICRYSPILRVVRKNGPRPHIMAVESCAGCLHTSNVLASSKAEGQATPFIQWA